jgi:opine dehydrogenase
MADDVPLAHVPFVQLAESAGVSVPLHRGFVDIVDALLGTSSWQDGLTLERLGLAGLSPEQIRNYVETGVPPA